MNPKTLALTLGALIIGATLGVAGIKSISAATENSSLVQSLAKKLSVSEDKVKSAVEETRSEREAKRKQEIEDKLTQAVKDGKISESQKSTILSKLTNIERQMEEVKNAHEDLKKYLDDQNVDLSNLLPFKGGFRHGPGPL